MAAQPPTPPSRTTPPLTAVLGPAGAGKTRWCIDRYVESGGEALLLVPSEAYAERLRARIATRSKTPTSNVLTFGAAIRRWADCDKASLHRTCQRLTVAGLLDAGATADGFFGRVRSMRGFVDAFCDSLRELKLSGITPEGLTDAIRSAAPSLDDPAFERKASEIAALYGCYQRFLSEHGVCDEEDQPARAAERLRAGTAALDAEASIRTVLVDGFFRLSKTWRDVLAAISGPSATVAVTLPFDESRPLLFATSGRTLESLEREFSVTRIALETRESVRPAALSHLEREVFRGDDRVGGIDSAPDASSAIRIFDAPNPYAEAEMVVRVLRREHEMNGTPYERCAVIVRSSQEYADLLRSVGDSFKVPMYCAQGLAMVDQPIIKTLLTLCSVALNGWRRDDVIGLLKSSYTPFGKVAADGLRARASRRGLRQGIEGWRAVAAEAAESGDSLAGLLGELLELDRTLNGPPAEAGVHAKRLEDALETMGLMQRADSQAHEALTCWKRTVGQVVAAARLHGRGPMSFAEFHRDMLSALRSTPFVPHAAKKSVTIVEPYDTGQIDAAFVAVMGLTERVFPRRVIEDPFFREDERAALREPGGIELEMQRDRADDERLLFYMAVTAPRERMVLSFPRSAEDSDTLPSFYLDEVRCLFSHIPTEIRTLADVAPRQDECVNERDRTLASCALAADGGDPAEAPSPELLDSPDRPRLPRLTEDLLRTHAAPRRYSITEIETHRRCPFQHLMKYGLKLRAASDGAGEADKGTLLHAVMRRSMRKRKETPPEEAADAGTLEGHFAEELAGCLNGRSIDANTHRKRMMERALRDALREMARREVRYTGLFGTTPAYFELAFGQEPEAEPDDEEIAAGEPREYDAASMPEPLVIPGEDGSAPIHLCGAIDRVDLLPDGRRAIVLDYKLRSSVEWDQIKQGKSLQMSLYMLAVEQLWGKTAAAGCYESPRDRGRRRFYRKGEVDVRAFQPIPGVEDGKMAKPLSGDDYGEAITSAKSSVRQAVAGIQSGAVLPTPGDYCRWCDYADVCRVGRDGVHDGEAYSDDGPGGGA